jgi:hypothetical protein
VLAHDNLASLADPLGHVIDPCGVDRVDAAALQFGTQVSFHIDAGVACV